MSLQPDQAPRQRSLELLARTERLILNFAPSIDRIPRSQRYRYGARLEAALWELAERIIEAACSGAKSKVYRADEQVRLLHCLIRHGASRELIKPRTAGERSAELSEIGAMLGAWRKKFN